MKKIILLLVPFFFFITACKNDQKMGNAVPPAHFFGTVKKIDADKYQVIVQLTEVSRSEKLKKGDKIIFDFTDLNVQDLDHPGRKATISEISAELTRFKVGSTVEYYFEDENLEQNTFKAIIQNNIFITK